MEDKRTEYPYPEELMNENGYPTEQALEYINNWSIIFKDEKAITGIYFGIHEKENELIEYIKKLWCWHDFVRVTKNSLTLITGGWSGNEDIIPYLKKTWFWRNRWFLTITGGGYYFALTEQGRKEIINNLKG